MSGICVKCGGVVELDPVVEEYFGNEGMLCETCYQQRRFEIRVEAQAFERTCLNALNSVSREQLTDEEWEDHRRWVADNWEDMNAATE